MASVERLYAEFPEYPFLRSPLISHDNIIIASVYGNDVFAIDSMYRKILSFEEVKKAEQPIWYCKYDDAALYYLTLK